MTKRIVFSAKDVEEAVNESKYASVIEAARKLGVSKWTMYKAIKHYNIPIPEEWTKRRIENWFAPEGLSHYQSSSQEKTGSLQPHSLGERIALPRGTYRV